MESRRVVQSLLGADGTKQNNTDLHLDKSTTHSTPFVDEDEEEFTKALEEKIAESRREVQSLLDAHEDFQNTTLGLGSSGAQTPEGEPDSLVTEETGSLRSPSPTPSPSRILTEEYDEEDEETKTIDTEPKTIDIDDMIAKKEESIRVREATARTHERRQRLEVRQSEHWNKYLSTGSRTFET